MLLPPVWKNILFKWYCFPDRAQHGVNSICLQHTSCFLALRLKCIVSTWTYATSKWKLSTWRGACWKWRKWRERGCHCNVKFILEQRHAALQPEVIYITDLYRDLLQQYHHQLILPTCTFTLYVTLSAIPGFVRVACCLFTIKDS